MKGERGHLQNTVDTGTLWAPNPLGNVYLLWQCSQRVILMMAQRLPWDLMSVFGFVFVRDKCMLLSCLHFSPILPPNNESVSASRDSEVIIHKVQIL